MDGGTRSFTEFFEVEYQPVLRVTYVIVGSWHVAQEITQEAFTKAFVNWRRVSGYDRPGAWVRRVAIRDAVRSRKRSQRPLHVLQPSVVEPPELAETAQLLTGLSAKQRAAVALHYLEDRPVDEVAAQLRCTPSTVRTHLQRAREVLAVSLAETTGGTDV